MKATRILMMMCGLLMLVAARKSDGAPTNQANAPPQMSASQEANPTASCTAFSATDSQMAPLASVCAFALRFRHSLPDFTCEQTTIINSSQVTQALVTYVNGKEHYSNVVMNGKPVQPKGDADTWEPALFTYGEFGSDLVSLLTLPVVVEFKFRKESTVHSHRALIYEFHLPADKNTFWTIYGDHNRNVKPELRGELWIEPKSERLLRLQLEPVRLPQECAIESATTSIDYSEVSLGDAGVFLLPSSSTTDAWVRREFYPNFPNRIHSVITFHNCHKFTAKAHIVEDH